MFQLWNQSFRENFLFKFQFVRRNKKPNGNSSLLSFSLNCPTLQQGNLDYNAYEKDIAIVNIFFGESTVFGEETSKNRGGW